MSATIKTGYWCFYLEGRRERLLRNDIDLDKLADSLLERGGVLHDVLQAACEAAAAPMNAGKVKRVWLEEHADEIKAAGGDGEEAFGDWRAGRVDELASAMEPSLIEALEEDETSDGDDGEDEDEDEDD
jgi:hypothetical protein